MGFDVWFNGVALSRVAPRAKVVTFDVEKLTIDATTYSTALMRGARFVRTKIPSRQIRVSIKLGGETVAERAREVGDISAWALSDTPKRLTASHMLGEYFDAMCTALPGLVGSDRSGNIQLAFTAGKPEYISAIKRTAAHDETVVISGSVPTWVNLRAFVGGSSIQSGGEPNFIWTLGGLSIALIGEIPEGYIDIDSENETILHTDANGDKTDLLGMLTYASRFWLLKPGAYTPTASVGTFSWQERRI